MTCRELRVSVPATFAFDCPSVDSMVAYLEGAVQPASADLQNDLITAASPEAAGPLPLLALEGVAAQCSGAPSSGSWFPDTTRHAGIAV